MRDEGFEFSLYDFILLLFDNNIFLRGLYLSVFGLGESAPLPFFNRTMAVYYNLDVNAFLFIYSCLNYLGTITNSTYSYIFLSGNRSFSSSCSFSARKLRPLPVS